MYSNSDLEAAVSAGVLNEESVKNFREYIAKLRNAPAEDEENFRLLTGFNDIFVAICLVLTLGSITWFHGSLEERSSGISLGALSWLLAEYFTKKRRMALPSILLLLSFVGAAAYTGLRFGKHYADYADLIGHAKTGTTALFAGLFGVVAAWFHWRRFQVPITVAIGAASLITLVLGLLGSSSKFFEEHIHYFVFLSGVSLFIYAMKWDLSDLKRTTKKTDIAFWLHLLASPIIVHSLFKILGIEYGYMSFTSAVVIIGLYVVFAIVSLLIDRRALLVSSLIYVLYAASVIVERIDVDRSSRVAFTAAIVGSGLLLLSALWTKSRQFVLKLTPPNMRSRLTATGE